MSVRRRKKSSKSGEVTRPYRNSKIPGNNAKLKGDAVEQQVKPSRAVKKTTSIVGSVSYKPTVKNQTVLKKEHKSHVEFKGSERIDGTLRKSDAVSIDRINGPGRMASGSKQPAIEASKLLKDTRKLHKKEARLARQASRTKRKLEGIVERPTIEANTYVERRPAVKYPSADPKAMAHKRWKKKSLAAQARYQKVLEEKWARRKGVLVA